MEDDKDGKLRTGFRRASWTKFLSIVAVLAIVLVATSREVRDRTDTPVPRTRSIGYNPAPEMTQRSLDMLNISPTTLDLQRSALLANSAVMRGDYTGAERELRSLQKTWGNYKDARRKRGYGSLMKTGDLDASIPSAITAVRSGDKQRAMGAIGRVRNEISTRS